MKSRATPAARETQPVDRDPLFTEEKVRIGALLRKQREHLGLRQSDVSRMVEERGAKMHQTYVSHAEDGRSGFTHMRLIAEALGLELVLDAVEPGSATLAPGRMASAVPAAISTAVESLTRLYDRGDYEAYRLIVDLMGVADRLGRESRNMLWGMVSDPSAVPASGFAEIEEEPTGS